MTYMDVDYPYLNELLALVRAEPATIHDADVVHYHLAALESMPLSYSRLDAVEGVPELVELMMQADDRTYGIFYGFAPGSPVLRAYGYWRDPATDRHSRVVALDTARKRYWMDHADD